VNDLSIRLTRRTNFGDKTHEETIDLDLGKLIAAPAPVRITNVSTLDVDAIAARMAGQHAHAQDTIEWSPTLRDGKRVNFADAEKACSALGEGWRLPTRMELESILDLTRHDPGRRHDALPRHEERLVLVEHAVCVVFGLRVDRQLQPRRRQPQPPRRQLRLRACGARRAGRSVTWPF
jgi:hypothetical protein